MQGEAAEEGVGQIVRHAQGRDVDHLALVASSSEGAGEVLAAHGVEDEVKAAPLRERLHVVVDALLPVEDDIVGAEVACHACLLIRGDGDGDAGAVVLGDLDGDMADAACPAVHEHVFIWLETGPVDQTLPGGDGDERQGCGLGKVERARLGRDEPGVGGHVFRQRSAMPLEAAGAGVDLIALLEGINLSADLRHDACDIAVQDCGESRVHAQVTAEEQVVHGVEATRFDLDEDLVRVDRRHRDLRRLEAGARAECARDQSLHRLQVCILRWVVRHRTGWSVGRSWLCGGLG